MRTIIIWIASWVRPDRRALNELADFLRKRKKAASRWDHSHLTRRLATQGDADEYRALPAEKRFILLQSARFSASFYSVATLPALALGIALIVPVMLKHADWIGVPLEYQVYLVYGVAVSVILVGIIDLYGASKSAAHAKTWVSAFEDVEKQLATPPSRSSQWKGHARRPTPLS